MRRLVLALALSACSVDADADVNPPTLCRQIVECSLSLDGEVDVPGFVWDENDKTSPRGPCTAGVLGDFDIDFDMVRNSPFGMYIDAQVTNAAVVLGCYGMFGEPGQRCEPPENLERFEDVCDATEQNGITHWPPE